METAYVWYEHWYLGAASRSGELVWFSEFGES